MKHGIQLGQAINPLFSCGDDQDLAVQDSPLDDGAQQVISRRFEFWTDRLKVFAPAEPSSCYPACQDLQSTSNKPREEERRP